ncbi:peptide deformylase [Siculibacillus lacustris]|uniref:Peptide deformylase n=1 Tax=Siculibacillus lacustris TaxID=1549641 RepID=A0A4Q9VVP1_9HYPH|nr:peptide deformylase [Siculibacillus lacustris]TBW39278.1 peptide deformylase [Siculibacillus lacustris]
MTKRDIITLPDPRLKLVSEPVAVVDDAIRALLDDMLETMYAAPGIGLAAIQIGIAKRLVTIDVAREGEPPAPMFLVNPKILWASEDLVEHQEGCLSVPEHYDEVVRPARVRVAYLDRDGAPREIEADGLLAVCLQHEIDHLDGVMFVDHLSRLKRERVTKRFAKQAKLKARDETPRRFGLMRPTL